MSERNSFVLYIRQRKHFDLLTREQKGDLLSAIFAHAAGEDPPQMDGMTQMAYSFVTDQMDRDNEKYQETIRKRSEAGKRGGRPKKAIGFDGDEQEAKKANGFFEKQTKAKKADNVNFNVNVNDIIKPIVEQGTTEHKCKVAKSEYPYKEIIDYLNEKTGKHFKATSKDTKKLIKARFTEGYTLDDFRLVIDIKTEKWKGVINDKGVPMEDYLRPSTLFGTKFESYANESGVTKRAAANQSNKFHNFDDGRNTDYDAMVLDDMKAFIEQQGGLDDE